MQAMHQPPSAEGLEKRTNPKGGPDAMTIIAESIVWDAFANIAEKRGIDPIAEEYNGVERRQLELDVRAAIPFPAEH